MDKVLAILCILSLTGCVLIYDDREYDYHYDSSAVEGFYSWCYYAYNDQYDWYFETWGSPDLEFVDVYINSWKMVPLERDSYGYWSASLLGTYFYCARDYEFEVVAQDYYGNVTYRMFYQ